MGNSNEMTIIFDSRPENEGLARVAAAAFCTQLNPTLEEVADLKTAVSEAVTNCIIHGYQGEVHKIRMKCVRKERTIYLDIEDDGIGIADVEKAMEPLYTTRADQDRSGMGFTFMEAFMDEVKVTSQVGKGTCVHIGRIHQGDKEARDTLFSENMGLVYSVARRFLGRGVEMEDLFQIGSIGLLKAVDHFNPEFDVKFSTYAVPMIIGEIKRFLRDDGILKVSRSIKENQYKICKMREELEKKLGREPDLRELSDAMDMPMEELAMTLESAAEVDSIYKIVYQGDGTDLQLVDRLPEKEDRHEKLLNRIFLEEILEKLEREEKRLIVFRYFQDMTQTEVAKKMGMSQVQISRMEKRILKKLREISHKL